MNECLPFQTDRAGILEQCYLRPASGRFLVSFGDFCAVTEGDSALATQWRAVSDCNAATYDVVCFVEVEPLAAALCSTLRLVVHSSGHIEHNRSHYGNQCGPFHG